METLFELLKKWNEKTGQLMSFEIFTEGSGAIYSHCIGDEMEKHNWKYSFIDIDDAIAEMKIKESLN